MEAPLPRPKKAKSKKRKERTSRSESLLAENKILNAPSSSRSEDFVPSDQDVISYNESTEDQPSCSSDSAPLNNLDIDSSLRESLLSKSQLNVLECASSDQTLIPPQEEEEEDERGPCLEQGPNLEQGPTLEQGASDYEIAHQEAEIDQLYPSLDEGFYQSHARIHSPQPDDVERLSLQISEANLDTIAPEDGSTPEQQQVWFPTAPAEDEEAHDTVSLISEHSTLHHLSLQTLVYDDTHEQKLQSCYQCVSPSLSVPSHEDLNKELIGAELKTFYLNPQLATNEEFLKDFIRLCENPHHDLHALLLRYQAARKSFLDHNQTIEEHIANYHRARETIWTFSKDKRIEHGFCADHIKVSHSESCTKAICHAEVVKEVQDSLEAVQSNCSAPLALSQYNWKIAHHQVEQYIVKLVAQSPPLYTDQVTSYTPGTQVPWELVNQTSPLRISISILFHFKRQTLSDEVFAGDVDRWLSLLVGYLLRTATLLDHRFLLNHLLRCPTGFSFWGAPFLQFVWAPTPLPALTPNPVIDHFFLLFVTLISPLSEREGMLANYEAPVTDSDPAEWSILDELGEVSLTGKQLLERDYLELLGQFNWGMFYREILRYTTPEDFMKGRRELTERDVTTLLSMCLQCINHVKEAFTYLDFTRYRNFCQRIAKIMTTLLMFASDYFHFYEWYGGRFEQFSETQDQDKSKLLAMHDFVFEEGFRCLAETSNASLWQFLTELPYQRVSIKVLWKLYCFLHQTNPERSVRSSVLREGSPYEIVTKLYRSARFQRRLEALSDEDCTYMVNIFTRMALSREPDESFVRVIALDIYHIGVTATAEKQSTDHACKACLSSVIDHSPGVVSGILVNMDKPTLKDLPNNLRLFKGISLQQWLPSDEDFSLLTTWLQTSPLTSLTNQLSRIILKGLNWGSHEQRLFIPAEYHRKIAVMIVAAHSYHLPDRPGYLIHSAVPDFTKHVSNSEKNTFARWCWEVLLSLCLHKTDLAEHDPRSRKHTRQIRKQKSECSMTSTSPDFARQSSDSGSCSPCSSFVGQWGKFPYKMRKEPGLNSLCEALRTNGEMAAFVALSITSIGHSTIDFQADGIQLLLSLQKSSPCHVRATLHIIVNLLNTTLRNKTLHLLINLPDFCPIVLWMTKAELSGFQFNGKAVKPFSGFVVSKTVAAYQSSQGEGDLTVKFWLKLFFSIPNFQSEPAVLSVLDKVCKVLFRYRGDEEYLLGEMRAYLCRCIEANRKNSSRIMSFVSWFSNVGVLSSLLQSVSAPAEYFWWSYYVTKMECAPQTSTGLFQEITEVLFTNPDMTVDVAFRRAVLKCSGAEGGEVLEGLTISSLAIYRWATLLHQVPLEHQLLPFAWQEFFALYFHRVAPESAGVGHRYFQGMFQVREIRAMKLRLAEASKQFELEEETEEEITEAHLFKSKLSHFFLSLSLWTDETRLHEPNLFLPGLPAHYASEKLQQIFKNEISPWYDMVDMCQLDLDLHLDRDEWGRYSGRRYCPRHPSKRDESSQTLVEMLYSYVSKNMIEAAPPPELKIPQSQIPPLPDVTGDPTDLLSTVGPYFGKLRSHAEKFVELSERLQALDTAYIEDVPNMFSNKITPKSELVPCYSRIGTMGRCSGPAMITIHTTQFVENTVVHEGITENRKQYEEALALCRLDLDNDVCTTAMYLQNIVSELYHASQSYAEMGRKLFYHIVDHLTTDVWEYSPSQQIFAFSIDYLGQSFIRNNCDETLPLLNCILSKSDFATVLAPLFQPNQGYENFITVYSFVIASLSRCDASIGFAVLSKFDLRSWLATPHSTGERCRELVGAIFGGFAVYTGEEANNSLLMLYDALKHHLRQVLMNRLCPLLQYTVDKMLDLSLKSGCHKSVWKVITEVLETDHAQEMLTLNTCHKTLYELSKYFLQFKKAILDTATPDLYSHWPNYTSELVELFRALCRTYISKAAILAPNEGQAECIFRITCAVFGPWILVYKEACLPWSEAHLQEANEMLGAFTELLRLMRDHITPDILIGDVTPLLNRFWWYYLEILGHPVVPAHVTLRYHAHFTTLPWDRFVPTCDILHSILRCVRCNRSNSNLVIYIMTKVNWQTVVDELQKESFAFDTLVDTLVTLTLNQDLFTQFVSEFLAIHRQFKALDLHLLSDEGFGSIMSRVDRTVHHGDYVQSITSTGHLLQFMGTLCRFPHLSASHQKQLTYFQHISNIITKISSNQQYVENLVGGLLFNMEQVFYLSSPDDHITQLLSTMLGGIFNTTPADSSTHTVTAKKIECHLKDRGSTKNGFSFSQLSLLYLSAITSTLHNTKMLTLTCETVIESYFVHCENSYPVLSVSWTTLRERFHLSDMAFDNFVTHCIAESCPLNVFLYATHLLLRAEGPDERYSVVAMLVDAASRLYPKPGEEGKMLLLWSKIFEILLSLHHNGIRSSAISSMIKQLPSAMLKLAEDRESGGLFNNWFGKKSKYGLEFRLSTRILATFLLYQVNKDGSLRVSPGSRHNLTSEAGKAMDTVRSLVHNKAYLAHIDTLQKCIAMTQDTSRTFLNVMELLRFLSMTYFSERPFLRTIVYVTKS